MFKYIHTWILKHSIQVSIKILTGQIKELCVTSVAGKSQLSFQTCLTVQLSEKHGNVAGRSVYLNIDSCFSIRRLIHLAETHLNLLTQSLTPLTAAPTFSFIAVSFIKTESPMSSCLLAPFNFCRHLQARMVEFWICFILATWGHVVNLDTPCLQSCAVAIIRQILSLSWPPLHVNLLFLMSCFWLNASAFCRLLL